MKTLARKNILSIKPYQPGRPIAEVRRQYNLKEIIKLASNENPFGASARAVSAIRKNLKYLGFYPDGNCFYLKKKLAAKLGVDSDYLAFGNGSNQLIELILKAFLNEGEQVLISRPDFLIFKLATLQEGGVPVEIPLRNFNCDLKAIKGKITKKTKIIFIANPNNPVGTYVGRKSLESFLKKLPKSVIVVLDEAYFEFAKAGDYPNGINYIDSKNVIVLRTFSKAYGLAGLRIGYAIARPFFINCLNKVRQPFNVNYLAQVGAEAALSDNSFLKKTLDIVDKQKLYLYSELGGMKLEFIKSATNFILFNCGHDSEYIFNQLLKKGIIVRSMKNYNLDMWVRVTVGKPTENQKFIKALKKVLKTKDKK